MYRIFKVHTDNYPRLAHCILKRMYGVTQNSFYNKMPHSLKNIDPGDIVYISEGEVSDNALFGPFFISDKIHEGLVVDDKKQSWVKINSDKSDREKMAFWIVAGNMNWCILFEPVLLDQISIIWPEDWTKLQLNLPSWGLIDDNNSDKLLDYVNVHNEKTVDFFRRHPINQFE